MLFYMSICKNTCISNTSISKSHTLLFEALVFTAESIQRGDLAVNMPLFLPGGGSVAAAGHFLPAGVLRQHPSQCHLEEGIRGLSRDVIHLRPCAPPADPPTLASRPPGPVTPIRAPPRISPPPRAHGGVCAWPVPRKRASQRGQVIRDPV
jgi:hypothetical protein